VESFTSDAAGKIFSFQFEGEAQPLKSFLLDRYHTGRPQAWRESFYPARVRLNGEPVADDTWVRPGDTIAYRHLRAEEPPAAGALAVLHEDEWLMAVHKPDDVPVSPSGFYYFTCLALRARELFDNRELTPVHRLDLETSGVLLLARKRAYLREFHELFAEHRVAKRYLALVHGQYPEGLTEIAGRIGPHPASAIRTKLWLDPAAEANSQTRIVRATPRLAARGACTELEVEPVTGKTNQIRVHLAYAGHPIVGDKKYHSDERIFLDWLAYRDFARLEEKLWLPRQALQCERLDFVHPFTGEPLSIEAAPGAWGAKIAAASMASSAN
jgi:23S rRNA pseudouridine1911/1915/1917 synthase